MYIPSIQDCDCIGMAVNWEPMGLGKGRIVGYIAGDLKYVQNCVVFLSMQTACSCDIKTMVAIEGYKLSIKKREPNTYL